MIPLRTTLTVALVAMGATWAPTALAQSGAPQFSCPIEPGLLTALSGEDGMDKRVYGLPVRQWKPEHLVQAQRQFEVCLASAQIPQSVKDLERSEGLRQFGYLADALPQRDYTLAIQAREAAGKAAAAQAGGSVVQSSGRLQWSYSIQPAGWVSSRMESINCDEVEKLPENLLTLTPQSQQDFPRFYAACSQAQQIPARTAALFKDSVEELAQDRQAQARFITTVQQASRQPQTHLSMAALEQPSRVMGSSDPAAQAAAKQLVALRQQVDMRECTAHATQAGVPTELQTALYLWRFQEPVGFKAMLCEAVRSGVSVKFSPKGMLSKDSFEMRAAGKPAVRVTVHRQPMSDGKTLALVPTESRIGNRSADLTRANWPQLTAALQEVMGDK